jgi:hypothetical protein
MTRPTEHRCRTCNAPVSDGDSCKCWIIVVPIVKPEEKP